MRSQMDSENELNKKNQAELETDLTSTKHKLLEIQHQLKLAEKVCMCIRFVLLINSNNVIISI